MAIAHQRARLYNPAPPLLSVIFVVVAAAAALLCFFPCTLVGAATYKVGGRTGWDDQTTEFNYKTWSLSRTFYVGDTIRFEYKPRLDNVVEVRAKDFRLCNQPSIPVAVYASGNDSITFTEEGCHYYITGHSKQCHDGQRVAFAVHSRGGQLQHPAESSFSCYPPDIEIIVDELYSLFCNGIYGLMVIVALFFAAGFIGCIKTIIEGSHNPESNRPDLATESSCPDLEQPLLADPSNPDSPKVSSTKAMDQV